MQGPGLGRGVSVGPGGVPGAGSAVTGGPRLGPAGLRGRSAMGIPQQQQKLPPSLQAKMDAMQRKAGSTPGGPGGNGHAGGGGPGVPGGSQDPGSMQALLAAAAAGATRPAPHPPRLASSPAMTGIGGGGGLPGGPGGLAARRAAAGGGAPMLAPGGLSGSRPSITGIAGPSGARSSPVLTGGLSGKRPRPGMTLSAMGGGALQGGTGIPKPGGQGSFSNFSDVIDPTGKLNFNNKAILTADGVDFSNGQSFKINMSEMVLEGELGKGNYGTVQKVYHKPTKVVMAMKEIRLELDPSKLNQILMELDILHRAVAPEIVEFYGAFLIESCVYYCMEYMDAGSLDTLHGDGVPEDVLARITKSMVKGLGFLKNELQIMHRDVKPTNVLVNKKGQVKLCDFGVSGQLEKSLAKTNIGCQSYMAPERIKGGGTDDIATYTVASDVWSVGLSIIEVAKGCYPYPPETYSNVFAQLQSIVYGPSPTLPDNYSAVAQDFVAKT